MIVFMKKFYIVLLVLLSAASTGATYGQTAYGFQMGDRKNRFGFVHFDVNHPESVSLDQRTFSTDTQVSAAEQVGDTLYAFRVRPDGYVGLEASDFVAYDPQTYTVLKTIKTDTGHRVVDMTYDYTTNTMYALVEDGYGANDEDGASSGKLSKTSLNIVDLATGGLVKVGDTGKLTAINGYGRLAQEVLVALAADAEGGLYGMGDYRQFYKVDKRTGVATMIGTQKQGDHGFSVAVDNVFQSMAFDAQDNLWWSRQHPDSAYLTRIVPATAEWTTIGHLQNDGQITGLHFVKPFSKAFPQAVGNLSARRKANTPGPVELAWTTPTADFDGTATTPEKIYIYRLGTEEPIAILDGTATSYADENPQNGVNAYEVQPVRGAAFGRPAMASVLAGYDTLRAVNNVQATIEGGVATITWGPPIETVNRGYADYDNIVYGVYRVAGYNTIVRADTTSSLTFCDTLDAGGTFHYAVIAFNHGVPGVAAYSNEVTYATSFTIPYSTGFEDDESGTLWTMVNKNHPSTYGVYGFAISPTGYTSSYGNRTRTLTAYSGGANDPVDDWAFSPEILIPAGRYVARYSCYGSRYADKGTNWQLVLSDDMDTTTTKRVIETVTGYIPAKSGVWEERVDTFEVDSDGLYRVAFHAKYDETFVRVYFDSLSITALTATGLGGVAAEPLADRRPVAYYTIDGRRVATPVRGVCIVRFSDGSSRKIARR